MIKKILNHPLFSGSVVMFVGNMTANAINYLYHLIFGRMLGPIDYGVLASLYSIIYLIGIVPVSASVSIVKFISSSEEDKVYSVYLEIKKLIYKVAIFLSFLLLGLSGVISNFLHIDNIWSVILLSPVLFLSLITLMNQATSQGLIKFWGNVTPTLISSSIKLILGIFFVYIGWSIQGAILAVVIGLFFAYLYSANFIKRHLVLSKKTKVDMLLFIKYSGPVLLQSLAFTSIFTVDVMLVKHFLDPFSAGIYAALSTLGKIIFFATSPITAVMFPVISKRKTLNQDYKNIFTASFIAVASISTMITILFWLFPDMAIGILYGKDYLSARLDLVRIGFFMIFYTLSNLLVNFFLSIGKTRIVAIPLIAALAQIVIISFNHNNITEIIQISINVTLVMFICLIGYTGYNLLYESKHK